MWMRVLLISFAVLGLVGSSRAVDDPDAKGTVAIGGVAVDGTDPQKVNVTGGTRSKQAGWNY